MKCEHEWSVMYQQGRNKIILCKKCQITKGAWEFMQKLVDAIDIKEVK